MPCKQHHAIKWQHFLFVVGRGKEKGIKNFPIMAASPDPFQAKDNPNVSKSRTFKTQSQI